MIINYYYYFYYIIITIIIIIIIIIIIKGVCNWSWPLKGVILVSEENTQGFVKVAGSKVVQWCDSLLRKL